MLLVNYSLPDKEGKKIGKDYINDSVPLWEEIIWIAQGRGYYTKD